MYINIFLLQMCGLFWSLQNLSPESWRDIAGERCGGRSGKCGGTNWKDKGMLRCGQCGGSDLENQSKWRCG